MTKTQSNVVGIVCTLAMVLLSAIVLMSAQASMPAASKMEAGSISLHALHQTVDASKLPVQDGYPAF
jgi:hypothetical protein